MVIAANVAIDEVCLHAAVRSSGPEASVRSSPHGILSVALYIRRLPLDFRNASLASKIARRSNLSRGVNTGLTSREFVFDVIQA